MNQGGMNLGGMNPVEGQRDMLVPTLHHRTLQYLTLIIPPFLPSPALALRSGDPGSNIGERGLRRVGNMTCLFDRVAALLFVMLSLSAVIAGCVRAGRTASKSCTWTGESTGTAALVRHGRLGPDDADSLARHDRARRPRNGPLPGAAQ